MEELTKITPDKEKAQSILKMVETTLEMINLIDKTKFPSNITKEYYEIIRELVSIILLLDGFKTIGEKAHKRQIEYLEANYKEFSKAEIIQIDDLRITRNKIAYDGFFVKESYIDRKLKEIISIIEKLKNIIKKKLEVK
mgnify:CR=1 FL=1